MIVPELPEPHGVMVAVRVTFVKPPEVVGEAERCNVSVCAVADSPNVPLISNAADVSRRDTRVIQSLLLIFSCVSQLNATPIKHSGIRLVKSSFSLSF